MDFRINRNFVNNGSKWWCAKCPPPKRQSNVKVKSSGQNDHLIFEKTGEAKKKCSKPNCNAFYAQKRIQPTSHTPHTENGAYKGIYAPKSTLIHTLFVTRTINKQEVNAYGR